MKSEDENVFTSLRKEMRSNFSDKMAQYFEFEEKIFKLYNGLVL